MTSHNSKREVEILSQIESLKASRKEVTPLSTDAEIAEYDAIAAKIEALYARLDAVRDGSALEIRRMIKNSSTQTVAQPTKAAKVIRALTGLATLAVHAAYMLNLI
jgi:hypothetical protein